MDDRLSSSSDEEAGFGSRYSYSPVAGAPRGFEWGIEQDTEELVWDRWESASSSSSPSLPDPSDEGARARQFWVREVEGEHAVGMISPEEGGEELLPEFSFLEAVLGGAGGTGESVLALPVVSCFRSHTAGRVGVQGHELTET